MHTIYVVASGQHIGKTTISLGLVHVLKKKGHRVHFCKPVGQQFQKIDQDREQSGDAAVFFK